MQGLDYDWSIIALAKATVGLRYVTWRHLMCWCGPANAWASPHRASVELLNVGVLPTIYAIAVINNLSFISCLERLLA